ncbi:hypothetical protein HVW69_14515 [Citrobacter freundii]|nr:hypothetical protein HVW69_14515 [Citrobacter freundii]
MITKQLVETIKHNGILASAGELKKLFTKAVEAEEKNIELEQKLTDMAVQLANAESKCRELAVELQEIKSAIPAVKDIDYDNDNMDDVSLAEDIGFNYAVNLIGSRMKETPSHDAFLAEVRAQGVEMFAEHLSGMNISASETSVREFAAQLRKGAAL